MLRAGRSTGDSASVSAARTVTALASTTSAGITGTRAKPSRKTASSQTAANSTTDRIGPMVPLTATGSASMSSAKTRAPAVTEA